MVAPARENLVVPLESVSLADLPQVGGKNASLGELLRHLASAGVRCVGGFATTVAAYRAFLDANGLEPEIAVLIEGYSRGELALASAGRQIRGRMLRAKLPDEVAKAIAAAYRNLRSGRRGAHEVAVRSSATAEDLPEASFAGQQETFLNVRGEAALLDACRRCFASLYTDRAISYRENHGIDQLKVALSVGVQPMVRSDRAAAGVMFSIDTETGFPGVVVINASLGLGETVVQGSVDPDEFRVFKPLLAAGGRPVIERKRGSKERSSSTGAGVPTRLVHDAAAERAALVLSDDEVLDARALGRRRSKRTTASRWTWNGRRTAAAASCSSCRRGPETVQARRAERRAEDLYARAQRQAAALGRRGRRRGRDGQGLPDAERGVDRALQRRARSSSPRSRTPTGCRS